MTTFRVWIRCLGPKCRVRVDGRENARWLMGRLQQSGTLNTVEPLPGGAAPSVFDFYVGYVPPLTRTRFESLLSEIPEVQLMQEPE